MAKQAVNCYVRAVFSQLYTSSFIPSNTQKAYWAIWIDTDKDGAFDTSERLFSIVRTGNSSSILPITLPADMPLGATTMRVAMRKGSALPTNGCISFGNGEVEDYKVNISAGGTCGSSFKQVYAFNQQAEMELYPNPSSRYCYVNYMNANKANGQLSVSIYSITGVLFSVQTIPLDNYANAQTPLDLSALATGIYIVQVNDGEQQMTQKLSVVQ